MEKSKLYLIHSKNQQDTPEIIPQTETLTTVIKITHLVQEAARTACEVYDNGRYHINQVNIDDEQYIGPQIVHDKLTKHSFATLPIVQAKLGDPRGFKHADIFLRNNVEKFLYTSLGNFIVKNNHILCTNEHAVRYLLAKGGIFLGYEPYPVRIPIFQIQ